MEHPRGCVQDFKGEGFLGGELRWEGIFDGALSWGGAKSHRPTPVIAPSYELSSTVSSNRALEFLAFSSKSGKKD